GVGGQRLAPRLGRLHGVHVDFSVLGVRNLTQSPCRFQCFRRTKPYTDFSSLGVQNFYPHNQLHILPFS
ncbi:hypothetical protein EYY89_14895, partial [Hafnia paralvei]